MALVTHVLHTPLGEVDGMAVDELMEWAEEARDPARDLR